MARMYSKEELKAFVRRADTVEKTLMAEYFISGLKDVGKTEKRELILELAKQRLVIEGFFSNENEQQEITE